MIHVGITGSIACGKSSVARILSSIGALTLDADDVARDVQSPGGIGFDRIVSWLGDAILTGDGAIDRARLAEMVFHDDGMRETLNGLIHPLVKARCDEWLRGGGDRVIVVPLLFEAHWILDIDATVCVCTGERMQMEHLRQRGLDEISAKRRISAQLSQKEKAERSDFVIMNDGDLNELRKKTLNLWRTIMEKFHDRK